MNRPLDISLEIGRVERRQLDDGRLAVFASETVALIAADRVHVRRLALEREKRLDQPSPR